MKGVGKITSDSLRQRVFQYIRDHPFLYDLSKQEQNDKLIEAFGVKDEKAQAVIKTYKQDYFNELEFARFQEQLKREQQEQQQDKTSNDILPKKKITKKYSKIMAKLQPYEKLVKCPHCPGLYANEVMKFVGFRGSIDRKGICHLDIKGKTYEGEAWPPPIVPVTNVNRENLKRLTEKTRKQLGSRFYLGILRYEVEYMTLIFTLRGMGYENIALLMARGMGKTYIWTWTDQLRLKHFQYNIMLLSETNSRLKVGNWIYVWALRNNYLKDPEKFARKSTYQHFELFNGNRMDIYKYSEEALVGEHDVILKGDDCVKRKWRERPTENKKMIDHFQSNINYIIRTGFELTGTCKFEGDPISHIINTIEDMIVIKQSPFIKCEHGNRNEDGTYDPCEICRDLCLLAPEIHSYNSLMAKMYEDFEAWYAEMMQNPHPMEGGMVKPSDIVYVQRPHFAEGVQMGGCGIDCASTEDENNDYTAVESCLMSAILNKEKKQVEKYFTFWKSDVSRMLARNHVVENINDPFDWIDDKGRRIKRGIFETTQLHVEEHKHYYPNIPYIIAWERNNAGIALMEQALRDYRNKEEVEIRKGEWVILDFPKYFVEDPNQAVKWKRKGKSNVRLGITHIKKKQTRIYSELKYSIETGESRFTFNMEDSLGMAQLLAYPRGKHDDSPDARGMIKDELKRRWKTVKTRKAYREPREEKLQQERIGKEWVKMKEPWTAQQNALKHRSNKNRKLRI